MTPRRLHLAPTDASNMRPFGDHVQLRPPCGRFMFDNGQFTNRPHEVTCYNCRAAMDKRQ